MTAGDLGSILSPSTDRSAELRSYIMHELGEDAALVLSEWLSCSRRPHAVCLAIVECAEGSTRAPALGWYRTKHGLVDLAATGSPFNAYRLRRFAERVPLPARADTNALVDVWYHLMTLGGWTDRDHDKMFSEAVAPRIALGMIEDARWQVEQLAPWSPAFQEMPADRKREYIAKALSFGAELFKPSSNGAGLR